jgi:hypothetical protein
MAMSTAFPGRFAAVSQGTSSANQWPLNADGSLNVQGVGAGATANFVAVGWSSNIGTNLRIFREFRGYQNGDI